MLRRPPLAALLLLAACGPREPLPRHMPAPARQAHADFQIGCWDGGPVLAQRKKLIADTLRAQNADDWRVAVVIAAALAETNTLSAAERDQSKDSAGDAKNYSAFNMNGYALKKLGWSESTGVDINNDANLAEAANLFNQGMNAFGESKWLYLHRGGETSFLDGISYGCREYEATIKAIATHLLEDKQRLVDSSRYGCDIPHV